MTHIPKGGLLALALAACTAASPPLVLSFGKNQVRTEDFDWKVRSTEHFDLYYYDAALPMVPLAAEILEESFDAVTRELGIRITTVTASRGEAGEKWYRRPFFLYASPGDFQQSTIVATGPGTGGVAEPFKDRFMIYNDGSRKWMREVIRHEFTHIIQFHVLISGFWKSARILKSIVYPLWMMEGMAAYLTKDIESVFEEVVIRDAATSGGLHSLTRLEHFGHLKPHQAVLAYKQGSAALEFMAEQYGREKVGLFLKAFSEHFETHVVLRKILGISYKSFDKKYREYVEAKYAREVRVDFLQEPDFYGGPLTRRSGGLPESNSSPVFTPDGKTMFYFSSRAADSPGLFELDLDTGKRRRLSRVSSPAIDTVPLGRFANLSRVLAISPDGRWLAFGGDKNHRSILYLYDRRKKRLRKHPIEGLDSVTQPDFSPDGRKIVFSAMSRSITDLYLYDIETRELRRLTDDVRDDQMPAFTPSGEAIIYSSEVPDSSDPLGSHRNLFRLEVAGGPPVALENLAGQSLDPVVSPDGRRVLFIHMDDKSSDIFELDLAGRRLSRLTRSVGASFSPVYVGEDIAFAALRRGDVHIYKGPRDSFGDETVPMPGEPESAGTQPAGRRAVLDPIRKSVGAAGPPSPHRPSVSLGPERPYKFQASTDLFLPILFYSYSSDGGSSDGGLFVTSYWQGSDLLGVHNASGLVSYNSSNSLFDYGVNYAYSRYRPSLFAGAAGRGQRGLVDIDRGRDYNSSLHAQFLGVSYPFDTFHRVEVAATSVSDRVSYASNDVNDRQARLFSYTLVRDTVAGRYLVATRGNRLKLSYQHAEEILGGNRAYETVRAEAHQYIPTGGQSALAGRVVGLQSMGRDRAAFLVGGVGGVRGYPRNTSSAFGSRFAVGNLEWRFPILNDLNYHMWYFFPDFYFKAVFGTLFADAGYAWDRQNQFDHVQWRDLRQSVGGGVRIFTFIMQEFPLIVSLDYAHQTTKDEGIFYVYLGQVF